MIYLKWKFEAKLNKEMHFGLNCHSYCLHPSNFISGVHMYVKAMHLLLETVSKVMLQLMIEQTRGC